MAFMAIFAVIVDLGHFVAVEEIRVARLSSQRFLDGVFRVISAFLVEARVRAEGKLEEGRGE